MDVEPVATVINMSSKSSQITYTYYSNTAMERGLYKAYAALIIDIICTVLFHQDVFCGYDEEKVYTYIFYRDTVIGELFLL